MTTGSDPASTDSPKRRRIWSRVAGWCATILAVLLLGFFGILETIAHRPSRVHLVITATEIQAEDARLKQFGLVVPDGSFLKEHPFEAPWTSHSLLVPSSWSEPGIREVLGSRHVRADLLLADLDTLQPVMERAYGGWDSAAAHGWNWSEWFAGWRGRLAAQGTASLSFDEAFAPMDALIAFQRDNHTQIPLSRLSTRDGSQTALLASVPSGFCTEVRTSKRSFAIPTHDAGQQVRTAKVWNSGASSFADAHFLSMPTSFGIPEAVRCGETWIPLEPVGSHTLSSTLSELWTRTPGHDRPRIERLGDGIAYARLPTFGWSNYEQVSSRGWAERTPADRVLIVDLRDNQGGSADYGLDVLKGWIDEDRMVRLADIGGQLVSSCLYAPLRLNYEFQTTPTILPSHEKFIQEMLDRLAQPYPSGCPRTVETTPARWTYLQRHFAPQPSDLRIVAVVNSHCGSDCELLTAMLASLPETIVVGANTYGVCQMIQPGYSILPHTGLRYRMALGRSDYYGDDRSVEGYGLDVDVVLPAVDSMKPEQLRELRGDRQKTLMSPETGSFCETFRRQTGSREWKGCWRDFVLTLYVQRDYYPVRLMARHTYPNRLLRPGGAGALMLALFAGVLLAQHIHAAPPHRKMKDIYKKQVEQMEATWRTAQLNDDAATMDKLLSDDYVGITMSGQVVTKMQQLDRMRNRQLVLTKILLDDVKVKLIGTTAIVTSLAEIDGTNDGDSMHGTYRYTRVYSRSALGTWKITNFEATRVGPAPDGSRNHKSAQAGEPPKTN